MSTNGVPDDFRRDFAAMFENEEPITLVMSQPAAWMLMSALQLALRHPHFPAKIRPTVEVQARWLQGQCATTPALADVAEKGWDAEFDVPRSRAAAEKLVDDWLDSLEGIDSHLGLLPVITVADRGRLVEAVHNVKG